MKKLIGHNGFLLGLGLGAIVMMFVFLAWYEISLRHSLAFLQETAEKSAFQDTQIYLRAIELTENGESEQVIGFYCVLLRSRLEHFKPEHIEDESQRLRTAESFQKARALVERLESEGRCLTNQSSL